MHREITNKYNEMLLLRTKNRIENYHKPTGITKLLERHQERKGNTREGFDKYFEDHAKEAYKTRYIRGLFRIPELGGNNHIVIDAEPEEQKMQLPSSVDESQEEHKQAFMSYPLGQPEVLRNEPEERKEDQQRIVLAGFEDPIYKYDEKPLTIHDYIEIAKRKLGKDIAVLNPDTLDPLFVINYDGNKVRIHRGLESLKPWFKFYDDDLRSITRKAFKTKDIAIGEFDHDKVDQIRLTEHNVKIKKEDLPDNVEYYITDKGPDDDNDDSKGGSRIRGKKDFIQQHHNNMMELEHEEDTYYS